jgi:hypothetical protein
MEVHDIGATQANHLEKPRDQSNVKIALHANGMDFGERGRHLGKITADSAGQDVFNPSRLESFHEKEDLMRTAVEITTALDVEDPHGR